MKTCGETIIILEFYNQSHPFIKIDDFIGDGKGSCVDSNKPCGEECLDGKIFCLATSSCKQVPLHSIFLKYILNRNNFETKYSQR